VGIYGNDGMDYEMNVKMIRLFIRKELEGEGGKEMLILTMMTDRDRL
jgi:hypothetical protein